MRMRLINTIKHSFCFALKKIRCYHHVRLRLQRKSTSSMVAFHALGPIVKVMSSTAIATTRKPRALWTLRSPLMHSAALLDQPSHGAIVHSLPSTVEQIIASGLIRNVMIPTLRNWMVEPTIQKPHVIHLWFNPFLEEERNNAITIDW